MIKKSMAAERQGVSPTLYLLPQMKDWHRSHEPSEAFLSRHENRLETISFGASYSPEFLDELYQQEGKKAPTPQEHVRYLSLIQNVFAVQDIRLGIRWDRVARGTSPDLSYYYPLLSYAFDNGMAVTLNIGPIKTFRWPEQHVPVDIMKQFETTHRLPRFESTITPQDAFGAEALGYADSLLRTLRDTFSDRQLQHLKTIQPENESFHKFGTQRWRFSDIYMDHVADVILQYFPDVGIMVNSSEFRNLGKIEQYFDRLLHRYPFLVGKLVSGVNYYHNTPDNPHLPLVGKVDSITIGKLLFDIYKRHRIRGRGKYTVEASEAMAEMWPPIITPGNSASEFRFVTQRIMDHILDSQVDSIIRIWGIERLAKAFYDQNLVGEQGEIIDLIKAVNAYV